tara:strand:- start:5706 stop:7448 length:1743 start_codon:yes stop_codon:yes gene_type:complete
MKLKSFSYLFSLLILLFSLSDVKGEEKIDIWNNQDNKKKQEDLNPEKTEKNQSERINLIKKETPSSQKILIEEDVNKADREIQVFGIYDPAEFNFNLNMWTSTKADEIRASFKRLEKIKLSQTSNEILENILLSFSYPPSGMSEKEFVKLKIDWLIENDREDLIENFLKRNKDFQGKSTLVQYLVDQKISQADIKEGCEKIKFIDSTIKDAYLEKFKIYCLTFNNKKSQAQLLLDLLREQKQSDKFFDDKINFLLGISDKTSDKINEKNLLNFYLSSVTIKDFDYKPSKNTKKEIWKYLNAANLIKLDDITDKQKIKDLEIAAKEGRVDEKLIFDIYKQIPHNLNTLINAKNLYQTLDGSNARSLIFQKYLLSEDIDAKLEYLFLLDDLFKEQKLESIYSNFLSDNLKKIGLSNIPEKYQEISESRILKDEANKYGKIKYNDKILHQSKIIKFYIEKENKKKIQKDIDKIFKKISKNRKYFYSAKDLALVEALTKDGFKIPENFNKKELASKYDIPKNLAQLIEKKQNAFLALKIVEIMGEDEPHQLDPETIYFITNLLNKMDLIKIRNKVLISALPQRV